MKAMLQRLTPFVINQGILCILFVVAYALLNRALMIGTLAGTFFLLATYNKVSTSNRTIALISLLLIAAVLILTLFVKTDSSLGRIFIYKISFQMLLRSPLTGIGLGNFQREYGLQQARFFESGNFTQKELLLADNTYYAFNDYFQFIVEMGVLAVCIIFVLTISAFRTIQNALYGHPKNHILKLFIAILIVIGIAAFFTHLIEHKIVKIILGCIFSYIILLKLPITKRYFHTYALAGIWLFVISTQYYFNITNIANFKKWEEAKMLSASGFVSKSNELYDHLYPNFQNNIEFLKEYNDVLVGKQNAKKSIFILKKILNSQTNNISYLKLANIFDEIGYNHAAEAAYLKSINIVPNRFIPKEALFKFYTKNKMYEQAEKYRNIILSMPIKVKSSRVLTIRKSVKENKNHQPLNQNNYEN